MNCKKEPVTRFDTTNRRTTLGAQTAKRDLKKNGLHVVDEKTRVDSKTFFPQSQKVSRELLLVPKVQLFEVECFLFLSAVFSFILRDFKELAFIMQKRLRENSHTDTDLSLIHI